MSKIPLDIEQLENVTGGSIGYNPDGNGTYTMRCKFTGQVFHGVKLADVIEIAKYGAYQTEDLAGEQAIIAWAKGKGYIHN